MTLSLVVQYWDLSSLSQIGEKVWNSPLHFWSTIFYSIIMKTTDKRSFHQLSSNDPIYYHDILYWSGCPFEDHAGHHVKELDWGCIWMRKNLQGTECTWRGSRPVWNLLLLHLHRDSLLAWRHVSGKLCAKRSNVCEGPFKLHLQSHWRNTLNAKQTNISPSSH